MSQRPFDRFIIMVIDGGGVGATPDAEQFGDLGANTLGHVREAAGLDAPCLESLGLGRIVPDWPAGGKAPQPNAAFGRMAERSAGKDTSTGHWEIAGCILEEAFPVYPNGFPEAVLTPFRQAIGRDVLCNRPASGTEVIEDFGREHLDTGKPILYTSGDSVFQLAAHNDVVPLETLYEWCNTARAILRGDHEVGRIIARPFSGELGSFKRTTDRRDFSVDPPEGHLLEALKTAGLDVFAIGKIEDIYAGSGVVEAVHTKSNAHGIELTAQAIEGRRHKPGLIFTNLVDFDTLYGHRRDPAGFRACLEEFDRALPGLIASLGERDVLVLTADHGNDPTAPGTDHTRECVPLLVTGPNVSGGPLGDRSCFADLGATVADCFGLQVPAGESFLAEIHG